MEAGAGKKTAGLFRLAGFARSVGAEILQGWMYHGNIAASLASLMVPDSLVAWSVRQSLAALETEQDATVRLIRRATSARRRPMKIVYNSETAARDHEALGYPADRTVLIPNGVDLDLFRPDRLARQRLRIELGLPENGLLVGMFARYHRVKDHTGFLAAARILAAARPEVDFILAGEGVTGENRELAELVARQGLQQRCRLLGRRDDIPSLTASLDLATLTSLSEGFPNVLAEAMACGVPCVATDAGESSTLLEPVGEVVPCRDPNALAAAWERILSMPDEERRRIGEAGREQVLSRYSLDRMTAAFEKLYRAMVSER